MPTFEQTIDTNLLAALRANVRPGEIRRFVVFRTATRIHELVVFTSGPYSTRVRDARKRGARGTVLTGFVADWGVEMNIQSGGTFLPKKILWPPFPPLHRYDNRIAPGLAETIAYEPSGNRTWNTAKRLTRANSRAIAR